MIEASIPVGAPEQLIQLFGPSDQHLRRIREAVPAQIVARDGQIHLSGDEQGVLQATAIFEQMRAAVSREGAVAPEFLTQLISDVTGRSADGAGPSSGPSSGAVAKVSVDVPQLGAAVRPRTAGQARYVEAIRSHDMVFCVGPAGTGKTYLAVATAVESLMRADVRKIVLVRPAVEAGESLGYLPGDMQAKINPYLRPLLDALGEMMDYHQLKRYMSEDVIEVAPLAYMRGRTLNGAFIIMDEAQNTTVPQMKMFLTRMGADSKVVVSGDVSQVDLPGHTRSGLSDALSRLGSVRGIARVRLAGEDIVRHELVQRIVDAYDEEGGRRPRPPRKR